jgi:excisionase family DNA binding protein
MAESTKRALGAGRTFASAPDRLLTVKEVASLTGLAVGTLYHFVSQGRIPVVRISPRCLRFRESDLQRWFDALTCGPEHPKENTRRER